MKPCYYCLSVQAKHSLGALEDKTLEITNEAIEEIENGFLIRTEKPIEPIKAQLSNYAKELEVIVGAEIDLKFESKVCENEDWIAKYRDSVTPIECGNYYIHPSWYAPKENKINCVIDPALAFGSGHHASTFGCLKALGMIVKEFKGKKVLDVGCGSGILSICAKKSGAIVYACDTDGIAVEATKDNAQKNAVVLDKVLLGSLNVFIEDKRTFDIVLANLLADIIIALPLGDYVAPKGYLVLSGILEKYLSKVLAKFKDFKVITQEINEEWATLVLQNKG